MDPKSREQFTEKILQRIVKRLEIPRNSITMLDGFENLVYRYEKPEGSGIMRITHSLHRNPQEIRGELHFLNHLLAKNIAVTQPILSPNGNWVEVFPLGSGEFSAVCFQIAPGVAADCRDSAVIEKMGILQGKIHGAARVYQPLEEDSRNHWDEELWPQMDSYLPREDRDLWHRYETLMGELYALPRNAQNYGLCHNDFHGGNFFQHRGEITLFDFDDCQYFWYAGDMATTLYYAMYPMEGEVSNAQGIAFMQSFIKGYQREESLPEGLLDRIPLFHSLREIQMYALFLRSFPQLSGAPEDVKNFMKDRRQRILDRQPILDLQELQE